MKSNQKYLNVDKGYSWVVRVNMSGKSLVVWHGYNEDIGIKIAKKVESLMNVSKAAFLEWYDYKKDKYLEEVIK